MTNKLKIVLDAIKSLYSEKYTIKLIQQKNNHISIEKGFICNKPNNLTLGKNTQIAAYVNIKMGDQSWTQNIGSFICGENCYIGPNSVIFAAGNVRLGNYVLLSPSVNLISHQHSYKNKSLPYASQPSLFEAINIGDNVWIGTNATILPGVNIGNNCIIGANALVNRNVPDNTIYAGVPAKEIKKL